MPGKQAATGSKRKYTLRCDIVPAAVYPKSLFCVRYMNAANEEEVSCLVRLWEWPKEVDDVNGPAHSSFSTAVGGVISKNMKFSRHLERSPGP